MTLAEHLKRATAEPWAWGSSDCSTFPADWVLSQTGIDPMAHWRGAYSTEGEAEKLIADAGGLASLFADAIDPIWPRSYDAIEGAVGVVSFPSEQGPEIDLGAIHTGKRWAIRSPRGLAMISAPLAVRAIWAPLAVRAI
jgi:hypothetical protein